MRRILISIIGLAFTMILTMSCGHNELNEYIKFVGYDENGYYIMAVISPKPETHYIFHHKEPTSVPCNNVLYYKICGENREIRLYHGSLMIDKPRSKNHVTPKMIIKGSLRLQNQIGDSWAIEDDWYNELKYYDNVDLIMNEDAYFIDDYDGFLNFQMEVHDKVVKLNIDGYDETLVFDRIMPDNDDIESIERDISFIKGETRHKQQESIGFVRKHSDSTKTVRKSLQNLNQAEIKEEPLLEDIILHYLELCDAFYNSSFWKNKEQLIEICNNSNIKKTDLPTHMQLFINLQEISSLTNKIRLNETSINENLDTIHYYAKVVCYSINHRNINSITSNRMIIVDTMTTIPLIEYYELENDYINRSFLRDVSEEVYREIQKRNSPHKQKAH